MIGVVVPAHNEEQLIATCVQHLQVAGASARLQGEPVLLVVVLDACSDHTGDIARQYGAITHAVEARNVGIARAAGAQRCLEMGCRWLAFTDADTEVAPEWLADQIDLGCDVVCGTVGIRDWGVYGAAMQQHFADTYTDAEGHRHIHGANMGVSAEAYVRAGGFAALACSEDVALVHALQGIGASIAWSARPRVWTSTRRDFRAAGGFGETLVNVFAPATSPALLSGA